MTGVLAGALEARQIPSYPDRLSCNVEGIFEAIDGKNLLTEIRLKYELKIPTGKRADAERALEVHERSCPAAASLERGIKICWTCDIVEE